MPMKKQQDLATRLITEAAVEEEIGRRATTQGKLSSLNVPDRLQAAGRAFLNSGTIVVLVSPRGSKYLDGLAEAIKAKNESRMQVYCEAIAQMARGDTLKRRKPIDLRTLPTIVDVRYGASWLAKHLLITTDTQIALSCAVWSGGKLDSQKFAVVQHVVKGGKRFDADVLALLVPPRLSKVERAMVEAVPADLSEVHVKGPSVAWTAAGVSMSWDNQKAGDRPGLAYTPSRAVFVPFYEQHEDYTGVQQQQLQQEDTKQQQQQQQYQDNQTQQAQQQQQQQQAEKQQQQQQQQFQQQQNEQVQQQQQQNQKQDGQHDQHQVQDRHVANTGKEHQGGAIWNELDGGIVFRPFEQEKYASLVERIDFEAMDATQSVKELLRLREQLITVGLG